MPRRFMGQEPDAGTGVGDAGPRESVIVTYTNTVGGQDELVFDGCSVIVDHTGEVKVARGKAFAQDLLVADLDVAAVGRARQGGRKKPLSPPRCGIGRSGGVRVPARKTSSTVMPPLKCHWAPGWKPTAHWCSALRDCAQRMGSGGWSSD